MAYSEGKRGFELASKSNHSHIIKDKDVQAFLQKCEFPKESDEIEIDKDLIVEINPPEQRKLEHIVAIDGGDTTVDVKRKFPSAKVTFFQFGASYLSIKDLKEVHSMAFISPEAMSKLKHLERKKLVLPTKNVGLKLNNGSRETLTNSVRRALFDFFKREEYLDSLVWFLFQRYSNPKEVYESRARCPYCGKPYGDVIFNKISANYTFNCSQHDCQRELFLTDIFRLHEAIDDDLGAGGIIAYVRNLVEHFLLIHTIHGVVKASPQALRKILFVKDGPLAFFGQTANMHVPMRVLATWCINNYGLCLVGIEKSGAFVEHAQEIADKLEEGQALLLSNKHIYSFIKLGDPDTKDAFGKTSYYGAKVIYKAQDKRIYVATIPTQNSDDILAPKKNNYKNLDIILSNVEKLKCDLYDNSLLPIALANKLVSISDHPSSALLEKFAKMEIGKGE